MKSRGILAARVLPFISVVQLIENLSDQGSRKPDMDIQHGYNVQRERERRFLVGETSIVRGASWTFITQGYFFAEAGYALRIRISEVPSDTVGILRYSGAKLAAKGPRVGDERDEYEADMDPQLAIEFINRCTNVIRKRRFHLVDEQTWEIDEFLDENAGLWIAELEGTDIRSVPMPRWAHKEITLDGRYNNDELAFHPVSKWKDDEWKPGSIWGDV